VTEEKFKRKHEIILVAVDDYIRTAQPITSASLNLHFKDLSSATLRNEMNALESMGYFKQLHTSSGRVPTSLAYKEYVNSILNSEKLNVKDIETLLTSYEDRSVSLISALSTLAKRLSKATNCPTVLVQHGLQNLKIVNIQIVPLIKKDALLLVETDAGVIDDSITIDPNIEKSACVEAGEYLSKHFKDKTIAYMIENIKDVVLKAGSQILEFRTLIEGVDLDFNGNPYHYIEIKEIPSFTFCAKTKEKALENYKKQLRLSLMVMLEEGIHIVEPGEENEDDIDWESICP